jgi:hypothetical protein
VTRARLAFAVATLLAAHTAAAAESRRWGSVELGAGTYKPNIDSEFAGEGPYSQVFGTDRGWLFRVVLARQIFRLEGPFEVGIKSGYFKRNGRGLVIDPTTGATTRSGDKTTFNIIPTSLTLTYRYEGLADRYLWFPFSPYTRLTLERYNWWATNGAGGSQQNGATNGWSWTGGLAFRLDAIDPQSGRDLDREFGINHTYLFADFTKTFIDDFGSSKSWDLSDTRWTFAFGMMFAF